MKRFLRRVALFALLGAIAHICIVWAIAVAGSLESAQALRYSPQLIQWPIGVPPSWPKATYSDFSSGRGIRFDNAYGVDDASPRRQRFQLFVVRFGWPCYSMQWKDGRVFDNQGAEVESIGRRWIMMPDWVEAWASIWTTGLNARRRLPIDPILPGFLINTAFFGSGLWLVLRGRRELRTWQRLRHGQCLGCGYPIGLSAICTECGEPVRPRSVGFA